MKTFALAVALAGLALAGACGGGGDRTGGSGAAPETATASPSSGAVVFNDADVAFAQGMIPHHRQAIEMAALAEQQGGDEVRELAARIEQVQEPEIRTLADRLREWGADVPAEASPGTGADGMGHSGMDHSGTGEGMVPDERMGELADAHGADFDRMFLESMVEHHEGAVAMAEAELAGGVHPETRELARSVIGTQRAEIDQMVRLLGP
ncbi:DUF305 domain-containing protein [Allonocardiopsis opalescens]|uniref:Uncharacterized protein (DUF305 family) n=1 Tax=Allonocardiopsis opalescens TaxID=1144618 RepID=A0A2T0QEU1_9ACTN|nr:DUF305 domain-containing protein [Allonocardiopsis opalescens]PRY02456.1 uncharacterized protein (DUF305 family) [Allonocardiopsis opalescens]